MVLQTTRLHSLLWWKILHYVHVPCFLKHSSVDGDLGQVPALLAVEREALNLEEASSHAGPISFGYP